MTRLITPPTAIDVTLGPGGAPESISGVLNGSIDPIARWKVVLNSNLLCELYHDVASNDWFVERVYD